jgi:dTDP-4-dehydrorhamnose reductase
LFLEKKISFDLTQPEIFKKHLTQQKWDVIINCIANTDTYSPALEGHWNVNFKGAADLTDFCNEQGIKLVHISTDYVYTNSIHPASENDVPVHGQNWYSYTKVLAEGYVQLKSKNYLIIRATQKPTPFPYPKAWIDQIGNFDTVDKIAAIMIKLVNANASGLMNVGTVRKSMHELALQTNPEVQPANKPAHVPSDTSMVLEKMNGFLKN